jgi:hypothetical protein
VSDREFWLAIARALKMILATIEKKYPGSTGGAAGGGKIG